MLCWPAASAERSTVATPPCANEELKTLVAPLTVSVKVMSPVADAGLNVAVNLPLPYVVVATPEIVIWVRARAPSPSVAIDDPATCLIRELPVSAIVTTPLDEAATSPGLSRLADNGEPPSPA
jgi:hypothetical protein